MSLNLDARQKAMLTVMGVRSWAISAGEAEAEMPSEVAKSPSNGENGLQTVKCEQNTPFVQHPRAFVATNSVVNVDQTKQATRPAEPQPASEASKLPRPAAPASMRPLGNAPRVESARLGDDLAAIAQMDATTLAASAAACTACGLCAARLNAVIGGGAAASDLMLVGEAPTEADDQANAPFTGPEGALLDNMLRAIGRSRTNPATAAPNDRSVFLTHAVKCRPPATRSADTAEMVQCQPYLLRQLALVRPKVTLAMGRLAAQALLGSAEPLGKLRGRVHHFQDLTGVSTQVIVTYAPSFLLRNPADKAKAWEDLCLAMDALQAPA